MPWGTPLCLGGLVGPRRSDDPAGLRRDAHLDRLLPERPEVVHGQPGLGLPLVHHLVQHGVLHLGPRMAQQVAAADRDLERPAGVEVDGQLAEPGAHPAGETDRDGPERAAEVGGVELLVERDQPVEPDEVAGPRTLAPDGTRRRRRVQLDGKAQEDALGAAARGPRTARESRNRTIARSTRSGALA